MTTLNSHLPGLQTSLSNQAPNTEPYRVPNPSRVLTEEALLESEKSEEYARWHICDISSTELDEGNFYLVWKDIKIILKSPQQQYKTEHLLCDKTQPSIYKSINEVLQSIGKKLSPLDKEMLLHYMLDICIEDISFRYQEYTCSLIEELEFYFDVKLDDMKRIEDIYRHRDITKMRGLLHAYMQEYRACDYYDPLLDSFKLIMIQKNDIDLEIIQLSKNYDVYPDSPSKLTRHNSIMRQFSPVGSNYDANRKKSVSFNDCDTEIIYEEQTIETPTDLLHPYFNSKKRSPPQSVRDKRADIPNTSHKEQQKRNIMRVEENMKQKEEKSNQRTCWYKESCECSVF